jgi:hypothetical protein
VDAQGSHLRIAGLPDDAVVSDCEVEALGRTFIVDHPGFKVSQLAACIIRQGPDRTTAAGDSNSIPDLHLGDTSVSQGIYLEDLTGFQGRTDTLRSLRTSAKAATVHLQLTQVPPAQLPADLDQAATHQSRVMRLRATFLLSQEAIEALTALTQEKAQ